MDFSLEGLLSLQGLFTLGMLILLQAVLGFDNLLYISLESKRVEESQQSYVRKMGIGFAIALRILLLFTILYAIDRLQDPFFTFGLEEGEGTALHGVEERTRLVPSEAGKFLAVSFNIHSLVVLAGGIFIIYTAFKEIVHMLSLHDLESHHGEEPNRRSVPAAIFWIMLMNLVFSFDSILSAIALTRNVWVMSIAVIISGVVMIWLADHVSEFLKRNRMYEVLGLFILFIVGILLVSEGAHLAHLFLFGYEILPMAKATFYFVIGILVVVDIVQSRYQKKLLAMKAFEQGRAPAT